METDSGPLILGLKNAGHRGTVCAGWPGRGCCLTVLWLLMIAAMPQFFWGWTGVLSHCLIPWRSLVLPLSLRFQPRDPAEEAAAVAFPVGPEVMMVVRPFYVFLCWRCNHSPQPRCPLVVPGVTQCLQGPCLPQQRASRACASESTF